MKKLQRILALSGIVLLLLMYGVTFFFALTTSEEATGWFRASLFCTIVIPVFLYANMLVYRHLKNRRDTLDLPDDSEEQ